MKLKFFWYTMFSISLMLIVLMAFTSNYILMILCLALAFIVRVKGNKVLFKEYDEKQAEKIKKLKALKRSMMNKAE